MMEFAAGVSVAAVNNGQPSNSSTSDTPIAAYTVSLINHAVHVSASTGRPEGSWRDFHVRYFSFVQVSPTKLQL